MKEVVFVRKNMKKWEDAYDISRNLWKYQPTVIADTYLEVSADLAFAQSHFPESELVPYLNCIALTLHNAIYGHKQHRWSRIADFWLEEIPQEIGRNRRMMLLSLLLFVISVMIGVVSNWGDPEFTREVMGSGYVDMTLENIRKGNPMGVYGKDSSTNMMFEITFNNIWVSFYTYVSGMLTGLATSTFLVRNGVMLGSFMTFCHQHGVLSDCLLALWMHGVLEITAIIIAGGAGLVLGRGWMFPGSLPRGTSFRLAARRSVKIIIGLVPFFVMAGFIESYVTRHTDAPLAFRLTVILGSLAAVIYYFVCLPYKKCHGKI